MDSKKLKRQMLSVISIATATVRELEKEHPNLTKICIAEENLESLLREIGTTIYGGEPPFYEPDKRTVIGV